MVVDPYISWWSHFENHPTLPLLAGVTSEVVFNVFVPSPIKIHQKCVQSFTYLCTTRHTHVQILPNQLCRSQMIFECLWGRVVASQILLPAKIKRKLNQSTNYVIVMVFNSCFEENFVNLVPVGKTYYSLECWLVRLNAGYCLPAPTTVLQPCFEGTLQLLHADRHTPTSFHS